MYMYCTTCIQITLKKKIKITYYRPFAIIMFLLETFYRWDEHIMLRKMGKGTPWDFCTNISKSTVIYDFVIVTL